MREYSGSLRPELVQVEIGGTEKWVPRDEVAAVLVSEEAEVVMTGLRMFQGRGVALEMLPDEMAALRAEAGLADQPLEPAA